MTLLINVRIDVGSSIFVLYTLKFVLRLVAQKR